MDEEKTVRKVFRKLRKQQLADFRRRMPDGKNGVEVEIGGRKFVAAVRRLTPRECARLQTVPEWYKFVTSETQQYKGLGNGWNVETIKHCFSFLPERLKRKPLTVLSLFDGISCGQMALRDMGMGVEKYIASEIDSYAIENTQHNYPGTVQVGSVVDIDVDELVREHGVPDLLIGGSPCQSFSFAGRMKGMTTKHGEEVCTLEKYMQLKGEGFEFEGQSYLFWEYVRVLRELRRYNPDIVFFLENVRMQEKWERVVSHAVGVRGVHIDSALVSAQHRSRIYWSNMRVRIAGGEILLYGDGDPFTWPPLATDIPQPEDRDAVIRDVLQAGVDSKYYLDGGLVGRLVGSMDKAKLRTLLEPQVGEKEAEEYMKWNPEYDDLLNEEIRDMVRSGYEKERERLKRLLDDGEDNGCMEKDDNLRRIMGNLVPPASKSNALLATMWKGAMANGCACVMELYEED